MPGDTYCIDASSLIKLKQDFPRTVFPTVWERIEGLVSDGRLFAPIEVFNEIEKDDILGSWAKQRKTMFRPLDQAQADLAKEIVNDFPGLAKPGRFGPAADPFVVALTFLENEKQVKGLFDSPTRCIAVTDEGGGPQQIPAACRARKLTCVSLVGLFQNEGWVFR